MGVFRWREMSIFVICFLFVSHYCDCMYDFRGVRLGQIIANCTEWGIICDLLILWHKVAFRLWKGSKTIILKQSFFAEL